MRTMDFRPGRGRARQGLAAGPARAADRRPAPATSPRSRASRCCPVSAKACSSRSSPRSPTRSSTARAAAPAPACCTSAASVSTLLWVALALALFRLVLQWPISMLPAKIAADVQQTPAQARLPRLQQRLLGRAVARPRGHAAGDHDQPDQPGHGRRAAGDEPRQHLAGVRDPDGLRDRAQPDGGRSDLRDRGRACSRCMRPLRMLGAKRSRELSRAQVRYAGAIAEANRLAEESQVFGVTDAQYERMLGFVGTCRNLFYRTQVIAKAVPNVYQSLIFVLLVVGLMALNAAGAHHEGRLLAIVLLLFRAAQNAPVDAGRLPVAAAVAAVHRSPAPGRGPLPGQRPGARDRSRCRRSRRWPSRRSPSPTPRGARSSARCPSRSSPVKRSASSAPPAPASRRSCRSCCSCAQPLAGRYLVNGVRGARVRPRGLAPAGRLRAPGTAAAARLGGRQHPLLPRRSTTRPSSAPRGWPASTTTS